MIALNSDYVPSPLADEKTSTGCPEYYRTPLRRRSDIADWIIRNTDDRWYDHTFHPFCLNVKICGCNFSFEHLLELWRKEEGDPKYTHNHEWLAKCRRRHKKTDENTLWEWGVEDACRSFVDGSRNGNGMPGDDMHRTAWDGTEFDVRYEFVGRSGGWLSIAEFEGHTFAGESFDIRDVLMGVRDVMIPPDDEFLQSHLRGRLSKGAAIGFRIEEEVEGGLQLVTLWKLYKLLVRLVHDTREEARTAEVEWQAAFNFFANACGDVPQPGYVQGRLFPDLVPAE